MIFWASSEIFAPAEAGSEACRRATEAYLNAAFATSSLTTLDCKLRYVPIIMPLGMRERYPARSRLRKKERVYDCAPQLNYDVFVSGSFEQQLEEYVGGIAPSARHLARLGASKEQIAAFQTIIAGAVQRILTERPDQPRH